MTTCPAFESLAILPATSVPILHVFPETPLHSIFELLPKLKSKSRPYLIFEILPDTKSVPPPYAKFWPSLPYSTFEPRNCFKLLLQDASSSCLSKLLFQAGLPNAIFSISKPLTIFTPTCPTFAVPATSATTFQVFLASGKSMALNANVIEETSLQEGGLTCCLKLLFKAVSPKLLFQAVLFRVNGRAWEQRNATETDTVVYPVGPNAVVDSITPSERATGATDVDAAVHSVEDKDKAEESSATDVDAIDHSDGNTSATDVDSEVHSAGAQDIVATDVDASVHSDGDKVTRDKSPIIDVVVAVDSK